MTTLIRGELIKAITTRTIFAYGAIAVALAVAQVLVLILPAFGRPMSLADKTRGDRRAAAAGSAARDRRRRR